MIKFALFSVLCVFIAASATQGRNVRMDKRYIEIFEGTPAWDLVKAIDNDDLEAIDSIIRSDTSLLNYQEPAMGISPLQRAVGSRHYKAAELLLKLGANPNLRSYSSISPIYEAISDGWYANLPEKDPYMLKLLLRFGADPNMIYESSIAKEKRNGVIDVIEHKISPLIYAIELSSGNEKIQSLIDHGADIHYRTPMGTTPTVAALRSGNIEIAHSLIVDGHTDISEPYYYYKLDKIGGPAEIDSLNPQYPIELLIYLIYDIPSEEYALKRDIIKVFEDEGWDYNKQKEDIPGHILSKIRHMHPDDFEEYLEKY